MSGPSSQQARTESTSNADRSRSFETNISFPQPATPRRSQSERLTHWPPSHEHALPGSLHQILSSESRGNEPGANLERKRRLTSTAEVGRRRTTTGGFTSRDNTYYEPRSGLRRSRGPVSAMAERGPVAVREVIDLTGSSSPPAPQPVQYNPSLPRRPSEHERRISTGSRAYQTPRWQPDHEVNECPICHRPFGFLFRRHHCRKCGRVVCNDCSPHRITIPRQYIVHPPGLIEHHPEFASIDLTQGDDDEGGLPIRRPNPALGGGEKVRLCNPCVPDPQPDLQVILREGPTSPPFLSPRGERAPPLTPFPSFLPPRPNIPQSQSLRYYEPRPHPGTRLNLESTDENDSDSSAEGYSQPRHHSHHRHDINHYHGHSRYHSLDSRQAPLPPLPPLRPHSSRPRHSSMFDPTRPQHGMSTSFQQSIPPRPGHQQARRIREEDLCPVCRGILPPKGADGDETDRENHIMECITNTTSRSQPRETPMSTSMPTVRYGNSGPTLPIVASSSTTPPPRMLPTQMLRFIATEKDCTSQTQTEGADTSTTECSICMVEYEVGDRLVRLECWCKFHEECIVEWFGRKAECPVHKLS